MIVTVLEEISITTKTKVEARTLSEPVSGCWSDAEC